MVKAFQEYITQYTLCRLSDSILVAVSGGIDSVVLLNLFVKTGYSNLSIAHCNFKLRGQESDEDQKFVEAMAKKNKLKIYTRVFNTCHWAQKKGISIQMAARELRFDWFTEILKKNNIDYIAIGHNKNDKVETFLINLTRGTGIKGLTALPPAKNQIIRPLLFASRQEIETFAHKNNINYREDSSNKEIKYTRNILRHKIIPELRDINPSFDQTIIETIDRLSEFRIHIQAELIKFKKKYVMQQKEEIRICISAIEKETFPQVLTFEILREYNFTSPTIQQIYQSIHSEPGKIFLSSTHKLIKDRDHFIIKALSETDLMDKNVVLTEIPKCIDEPFTMEFNILKNAENFQLRKEPNCANLDLDKIQLPLEIRKWQKGDSFQPLGLKGTKKLSDYFTNKKLSLFDKEKIWVLSSNNKIIWLINHRIDHNYRITSNTKNILQIILKRID